MLLMILLPSKLTTLIENGIFSGTDVRSLGIHVEPSLEKSLFSNPFSA